MRISDWSSDVCSSDLIDDDGDLLSIFARMAKRGERIGGFARLADEERQAIRLDHRRTIAKFRCHIEIDRHARELFEPVARNHPGIKARAAGNRKSTRLNSSH